MAKKIKIAGSVKKTVTARTRNPLFFDEKYTGPEPDWTGDEALKLSDDEFDSKMRKSMNYYNYFYTQKSARKQVLDWVNKREDLDADTKAAYKKTAERYTPMTVYSLILAAESKMPLKDHHVEFILGCVHEAIRMANDKLVSDEAGPVLLDVKDKKVVKAKAPSVRDRVNDIVDSHIAYFEAMEEEAFKAKKPVSADAFAYLTAKNFPKPGLSRFKKVFETKLAELQEALTGKDKQLKEGYRHFMAPDFTRRINFYKSIIDDAVSYDNAKKAVRKPRVKKAVSKEKLVAKVKYMKQDAALKISSVPPVNIIGAKTVWVYQTKYRKIGCYIADTVIGELGIKGTTIVGFDPVKSVCKNVRKPEITLAEFMKAGKVQLRKFLENIKATEVQLTGRLSEDVLILKVE